MRARGFTLIELVVTVGIVALLATAAVPSAQLLYQRERESELRAALRTIRGGIDAYKLASDSGRIKRKLDKTGFCTTWKGWCVLFVVRIARHSGRACYAVAHASPTSASALDGRVAKIEAPLDASIALFFGITSALRPLLCEELATLKKIRPARAASRVDADPTSSHKATPTLMYKLLH